MHKSFTLTGDGHVISGAEDGWLALYNAETGAREMNFIGHTGDVWAVAVSPDDRLLVSGSSDQTLRLWDIRTGINLLTIFVANDYEWVAATPDGYYTSSLNGDKYLGWLYRREVEEAVQFYRASQFQKVFYRPDVVTEYLKTAESLKRPDIRLALQKAGEQGWTADQFGSDGELVKFTESLPPRVQLKQTAPQASNGDGWESAAKLFTLKFVVESTNGLPITEVSVFLNGVRKSSFKGDANTPDGGKRMEIEMQVPLEQTENMLYILASNERATSKVEVLKVRYSPGPGASTPKKEALPAGKPFTERQSRQPATTALNSGPVRLQAVSFSNPRVVRLAAARAAEVPEVQITKPVTPHDGRGEFAQARHKGQFQKGVPRPGQPL